MRASKLSELKPVFVDEIPYEKEHGILYVSEKYRIAVHLCACGCLNQAVTPIGNAQWTLTKNGDKVSLTPSIGNFSGQSPYHAHYFIRENRIEWCDEPLPQAPKE